jgi:hypothetical protein
MNTRIITKQSLILLTFIPLGKCQTCHIYDCHHLSHILYLFFIRQRVNHQHNIKSINETSDKHSFMSFYVDRLDLHIRFSLMVSVKVRYEKIQV